ncbi:MAG: helix-turn-helix domain-containing protein [Ornithinimicrobium sp.]
MGAPRQTPPAALIPARLQPCVESVYGYQACGLTPGVHRGLPSSSLTMVFSLDAPLRTAPTWQTWTAGLLDAQWTVLGGLHTKSALIEQPSRWRGVQLALHPLGARRLFGLPASALPTNAWDARELLGPGLDQMRDRLIAAQTWEASYRVIFDFLLDRLDRQGQAPVRPEVAETWRVLQASGGRVRISELSAHTGYSRRRLSDVFSAELALTPKTAARLIRFEGARHDLAARASDADRATSSFDLAGLAADHGYYDHAHLVRDFVDFAGLSPSGWLDEEFPNIQASSDLGPG